MLSATRLRKHQSFGRFVSPLGFHSGPSPRGRDPLQQSSCYLANLSSPSFDRATRPPCYFDFPAPISTT